MANLVTRTKKRPPRRPSPELRAVCRVLHATAAAARRIAERYDRDRRALTDLAEETDRTAALIGCRPPRRR